MGQNAGQTNQFAGSIAIGTNAGQTNQGTGGAASLALGTNAGQISQAGNSMAIGTYAGYLNQAAGSCAVGTYAGYRSQSNNALAFGPSAGQEQQGTFATAIGYGAGNSVQGTCSVCIGCGAGRNPAVVQAAYPNSIILNAQGDASTIIDLRSATSGFFVNPIRAISNTYTLQYDTTYSEITYAVPASDIRLKTDINSTSLGLNFINKLRPVEFRWKDRNLLALNYDGTPLNSESPGKRIHQGLIAQEVETVLDELNIDSAIFITVNDVPSGTIKGQKLDENGNPTIDVDVPLPNGPNGIQGIRY
jgi:hypothetical protein